MHQGSMHACNWVPNMLVTDLVISSSRGVLLHNALIAQPHDMELLHNCSYTWLVMAYTGW